MRKALWLLLCLFSVSGAYAQNLSISGRIVDGKDQSALIGSNVLLTHLPDSVKQGAAADANGGFSFTGLTSGRYVLSVSFLGYTNLRRTLDLGTQPLNLGALALQTGGVALKGVEVVGQAAAAVQKGDTAQYDARAFKTNPDANAQDLITKMPGVVVTDGKIQAQGEQVQRVLVDGKEFFGSDPDAVLKNLPAEAIDKIQVYDRRSDQSAFTGFNDGNTEKTINITTKPSFRNGQFGRILAGAGPNSGSNNLSDGKYRVSGNLNSFKGTQRLSIVAQSNNVNEQNFGAADLLGVVGTSAQGGGGARGGQGGNRGGGQGGGGNNASGNFLVNQSSGISTTHAIGLNYSDTWAKKTDVQASYFFNLSNNTTTSTTNRLYNVLTNGRTLGYDEESNATGRNVNNRFSARVEHKFDTLNSVLWTPRLTLQNNTSTSLLNGRTFLAGIGNEQSTTQSLNNSSYRSAQSGITLANQLLYRHRFAARGRTFSLGVNTTYNDRNADNYLASQNYSADTTLTDQYSRLDQTGWNWNVSANYTEPLSLKTQLQANYTLSYAPNDSDKRTYDQLGGGRTPNDSLSNVFRSNYLTNSAGLTYRYQFEKVEWAVGASLQQAKLDNDQTFPRDLTTQRTFYNVLPNATLQYKFTKQNNLRLNYNMRTQNPSISQLQEVVNNSNQLQIRTGNPNLRQESSHNLFLRYASSQPETSRSFFALVGGSYTQNYIGSSTQVVSEPTNVGGVVVPAGGQITRPINLDNQFSLRSFANYTLPLKVIKSNLNLNANATFSQTPGIVNQGLNYNRAPSYGLGVVLSSNISPDLDFTISSNSSQTYARNTLLTSNNSKYFRQNTTLRLSWIIFQGITLQSDVNHVDFNGLSGSNDKPFVLWNASLGKKVFAKQQGEFKLYAFDLLNQNKSINRNIENAYTEDVRTNILQQYFMLMFTYNIRSFNGAAPADMPREGGERRFGPPGGGPPPGGGGRGGFGG